MSVLTLANVRPWGRAPVDIVISEGVITDVLPAGAAPGGTGDRVDGAGLLALPGFVNTHAHVDKSWWGQSWVSYAGEATTSGRIAHERAERDKYGIPSVDSTIAVLRELIRHGTTVVRSHVDVDLGVGLRGIDVVKQAVAVLGDAIEIELVAFPQDGVIRRPGVVDLLDRAAAEGAAYVGGIDPASIDRDPVAQLDALFGIAERRGVGIDIHLHDGGELGAFQCELLIDRVLGTGLHGKVNVSHGFTLGDLPVGRQSDLLARLQEAGITWTTVAPIGSRPLPWKAMRDRGVDIGLGTDGIRDLWSPYGDGDMLRIAHNFAKLHQFRSDEDLEYAVELASVRAGRFVHRDRHDLTVGSLADVVLLEAENVQDALVRVPRREIVISRGRVVARAGQVEV